MSVGSSLGYDLNDEFEPDLAGVQLRGACPAIGGDEAGLRACSMRLDGLDDRLALVRSVPIEHDQVSDLVVPLVLV